MEYVVINDHTKFSGQIVPVVYRDPDNWLVVKAKEIHKRKWRRYEFEVEIALAPNEWKEYQKLNVWKYQPNMAGHQHVWLKRCERCQEMCEYRIPGGVRETFVYCPNCGNQDIWELQIKNPSFVCHYCGWSGYSYNIHNPTNPQCPRCNMYARPYSLQEQINQEHYTAHEVQDLCGEVLDVLAIPSKEYRMETREYRPTPVPSSGEPIKR